MVINGRDSEIGREIELAREREREGEGEGGREE